MKKQIRPVSWASDEQLNAAILALRLHFLRIDRIARPLGRYCGTSFQPDKAEIFECCCGLQSVTDSHFRSLKHCEHRFNALHELVLTVRRECGKQELLHGDIDKIRSAVRARAEEAAAICSRRHSLYRRRGDLGPGANIPDERFGIGDYIDGL